MAEEKEERCSRSWLPAWETTVGKKYVKESALRTAYDRGLATLVETKNPTLEAMLSERAGFEYAKGECSQMQSDTSIVPCVSINMSGELQQNTTN